MRTPTALPTPERERRVVAALEGLGAALAPALQPTAAERARARARLRLAAATRAPVAC
jgi:hypothetical protein